MSNNNIKRRVKYNFKTTIDINGGGETLFDQIERKRSMKWGTDKSSAKNATTTTMSNDDIDDYPNTKSLLSEINDDQAVMVTNNKTPTAVIVERVSLTDIQRDMEMTIEEIVEKKIAQNKDRSIDFGMIGEFVKDLMPDTSKFITLIDVIELISEKLFKQNDDENVSSPPSLTREDVEKMINEQIEEKIRLNVNMIKEEFNESLAIVVNEVKADQLELCMKMIKLKEDVEKIESRFGDECKNMISVALEESQNEINEKLETVVRDFKDFQQQQLSNLTATKDEDDDNGIDSFFNNTLKIDRVIFQNFNVRRGAKTAKSYSIECPTSIDGGQWSTSGTFWIVFDLIGITPKKSGMKERGVYTNKVKIAISDGQLVSWERKYPISQSTNADPTLELVDCNVEEDESIIQINIHLLTRTASVWTIMGTFIG